MADDLERASIADVSAESADDELPMDLDVLLFGARPTEAIVADLDRESLAEDGEQEVTDAAPMRATDADPGLEPIVGYRAEWRPRDVGTDSFDPTDLRAGADVSYGTDPPSDGSHDVDIDTTGLEAEPTEIWLGPAELPDDALTGEVTEVFDTYAPVVATDSPNFEDVD
jgi:hypothetical protein